MASRLRPGHFARVATVVAAVGATMVGLATPAFADPVAPPGWQDPGGGAWVAFTFDDTTLAPVSRHDARWGPVRITRMTSDGLDLSGSFTPDGWDVREPSPGVFEYGWPATWQLGSVQLQRADAWCDRDTATSCQYYAVDGAGQPLFFAAGNPVDGLGNPDPTFLDQYDQGVSLSLGAPPELNIVFSWDPSTATTPANGTTPGRLTLDASASDGLPGELVFDWTVQRQKDLVQFTKQGSTVTFDLDQNDVYCVSVKVTNTLDNYSKVYGVPDCKFVDGVAPAAAGPAPGGGGTGDVGGLPVGAPAAAPTVVFAPPRLTRSALTGGDSVDSSVIWLWRPEWYQSSTQTQTLPQTGGAPKLEGRADIVVSSQKVPDSDAGPWLAGLGAFGLIGIGWVLNKRRQVRSEY